MALTFHPASRARRPVVFARSGKRWLFPRLVRQGFLLAKRRSAIDDAQERRQTRRWETSCRAARQNRRPCRAPGGPFSEKIV
jgi:hypothetical protein